MNYWLIKSEPHKYSWAKMQEDGETFWDGVRNYAARIFLREMETGDVCFFYHSNEGKEIVGLTQVTKTAYQDPTTDDDRWVAVDVKFLKSMKNENASFSGSNNVYFSSRQTDLSKKHVRQIEKVILPKT